MAHIRRAVPDDAAEVVRLTSELGYEASESVISKRLSALTVQPTHFVAVAQGRSGTLAGWICAERRLILESGEKVEISGLVVDSTQRRNGIGCLLVEAAEQWTAECGLTSLVVRSNVDRPESHAFYLRAGYVRSKTQHVYLKTIPSNTR
ncbi:MAG TPA: GNAT family N-acetyltransferase [Steroidobacteraceae bacterium]|jgi:GNAT superfamily N-acetyltransferase|nr:GNAT family N-acetyltransferase [Steroidobacteraceae bacterium]